MHRLLDLPVEIITQILCLLDPVDVLCCRRISHDFKNLFDKCIILQYLVEGWAAGVEDNSNCLLNLAERFDRLRCREDAWAKFKISFRRTIPVRHRPSGIYDLTGGVYFLGDAQNFLRSTTKAVHYVRLPSSQHEEALWSRIDVKRNIIDIGLAVIEHDLLALVTSTPLDMYPSHSSIDIVLLNISTGEHHTEAKHPVIHVTMYRHFAGRCSVYLEIVGSHLALLLMYPGINDRQDVVYIYDWKEGTQKMDLHTPRRTYGALTFLSEDILLLVNVGQCSLDLMRISPESGSGIVVPLGGAYLLASMGNTDVDTSVDHGRFKTGVTPIEIIRRLSLPALAPGCNILSIACRGEPNPMSRAHPKYQAPFFLSSDDSLVIFTLHIQQLVSQRILTRSATLVVHRSFLLTHVPSPTSLSEDGPESLHWNEWGPEATRWLHTDDVPTRWITTTCGHRYATIADDGRESPICILDFNPRHVRRFQGLDKSYPTASVRLVTTEGGFNEWHDVFENAVQSKLPYLEITSKETFNYEAVLMDEERIIGMTMNEFGQSVESIDVLYFG